jgi:hypothetical protein
MKSCVRVAAGLTILASTIAALAFAGPTHASTGGTTAKPKPAGTLSGLRLCGLEQFDERASECRRDGRAAALVSSGLGCSATLRARRATRVVATLTYQGAVEGRLTIRVPRSGLFSVFVTLRFPTTLLPAGSYGCRFQIGRRGVAGSARSAGPADPVVGAAVCDTTAASEPGQSGCETDASAVPLTGDSITCSAVFAGRQGRLGAIELVNKSDGAETVVGRVELPLPLPLTELYLTYSPPGGPAPGTYACRYLVDGQVIAEKPFTIA